VGNDFLPIAQSANAGQTIKISASPASLFGVNSFIKATLNIKKYTSLMLCSHAETKI